MFWGSKKQLALLCKLSCVEFPCMNLVDINVKTLLFLEVFSVISTIHFAYTRQWLTRVAIFRYLFSDYLNKTQNFIV